jgi:hypothetical protein
MWCKSRLTFFHHLFLWNFSYTGWHCFANQWYLHIDRCHHYQLHLNIRGITSGSFSRGGYDIVDSSEGRTLLRQLPNRFFCPCYHRGFWGVFINMPMTFFHWCTNMAWTTKGNKGLMLCFFYKQRVSMAKNACRLHLYMSSYCKRRFILSLKFYQVYLPSL